MKRLKRKTAKQKKQLTEPLRIRRRSFCPIACTLDILGDSWSLLIIRDMMKSGKTRYGEFLKSAERIPTNILAERLKRLERAGIIEKALLSEHPPRWEYHLTAKGTDLGPALGTIYTWGLKHLTQGP